MNNNSNMQTELTLIIFESIEELVLKHAEKFLIEMSKSVLALKYTAGNEFESNANHLYETSIELVKAYEKFGEELGKFHRLYLDKNKDKCTCPDCVKKRAEGPERPVEFNAPELERQDGVVLEQTNKEE